MQKNAHLQEKVMTAKSVFRSPEGRNLIRSRYEKFLESWVSPNERSTLNTSQGETFVISSGPTDGHPVVMLHGTGSSSVMWTEEAALLSEKFRVHAIDIPGECGNSSEFRPPWKRPWLSDWLEEILTALKLTEPVLIGCSLGGWIVLDHAIRFPGKSAGLILLAPAGLTAVKSSTLFRIILLSFTGKKGFERISRMVYQDLEPDTGVQEFAALVNEHFIPGREALPVFSNADFHKISVPLCYFGGTEDCFYNSLLAGKRLKENIAHAEVHVLNDRGHVLTGYGERILEFTERIVYEKIPVSGRAQDPD